METTTLKTKSSLIKVRDEVLIFIKNDVYLKFTKIFQFPGSPDAFVGHINIWDDNAPFYILYDRKSLKRLSIKGYNKCEFIPNSFIVGYDKNNKMYLRCVIDNADTYLKYFPITSISDLRSLVNYKNNGHNLYAGFAKSSKLAIRGECFEIVTCKL